MSDESVNYRKTQWGKFLLFFHSVIMGVFWLIVALFVKEDLWNIKFFLFVVLMWILLVTTRDCTSVILTDGELCVSPGLWGFRTKCIPLEDIDFMESFEIALPLLLTHGGFNENCLAVGKKAIRVTCKKGISFVFSTEEREKLIHSLEETKKYCHKV